MNTQKRQHRGADQAGFSMIEVLIALTIFAIGILAVATMQITGIQGNATAKWQTESASWATAQVERLMSLDYGHADLADDGAGNPYTHPEITQGNYKVQWTVTPDDPLMNVKTVEVVVTFTDRAISKNTTLVYYKANL
jgi:prepilin-type N-terminal cleavage/methylation domain-containing protein